MALPDGPGTRGTATPASPRSTPALTDMRRAWALAGTLVLAGLLRGLWLDAGWFGVDQARDLAWASAITSGRELPIVGPLMRGRVHLGATYYFFWSLPALVRDDPVVAYGFAAFLGVAAVWGTCLVGRRVGGPGTGLVAALLLATSPIAVIDSRQAWAPAALPPLVAALLLAAHAVLHRPTRTRAAALAALATLGTQLHLAAAPLVAVAGVVLLVRARRLGLLGLVVAALAGAAPLVPMALAYRLDAGPEGPALGDVPPSLLASEGSGARAGSAGPPPAAPLRAAPAARDAHAGRAGDILACGARVLDGFTAPAHQRPAAIDAWLALEHAAVPAAIVAALLALLPAARRAARSPSSTLLVALTFLTCLLSVALLPAEAWHYYLDTTLVPASVLLAFAARARGVRRCLCGVALGRTLVLLWWVGANHTSGYTLANLEYLRLGGVDPGATAGRARLLSIAVKERVAETLVGKIGLPLDGLWQRVHGAGFDDVDSDNGYFLHRAVRQATASTASTAAAARPRERGATASADAEVAETVTVIRDALIVYRGELPREWTARFPRSWPIGPLEVFAYTPVLRTSAATIESCGDAALPARAPPDPRVYFFGETVLPDWPCHDPVVRVAVAPAAEGTRVRVFARVRGHGRVVALESSPPGEPVATDAPGAGTGLALAPGPAEIRVSLALDGPALLDLYELHGSAAGADDGACASPPPPSPLADTSPPSD